MKNKSVLFLYPLLSSLLFYLAWMDFPGSPFFFFIAFIPLLLLAEPIAGKVLKKRHYLLGVYLSLVLWNLATLSWMAKLGMLNLILIAVIYSMMLLPPFYFYHRAKRVSANFAYLLFVLCWFAIEFIHSNVMVGLPIQTLGYGLADYPSWIQWYEWTGVFGGSLWMLTINVLLFALWKHYRILNSPDRKKGLIALAVMIIPFGLSLLLQRDTQQISGKRIKTMAIHSNLDCYSEKYNMPVDSVLDYYYQLILADYNDSIDLVLLPENAVTSLDWVEGFYNGGNDRINNLKAFSQDLKLKNFVAGGVAYELYEGRPEDNLLATYMESTQQYVLMYNMVLNIHRGKLNFRTKEKLVPFEETHPFPRLKDFTTFLYNPLGGFTFSVRKGNRDNITINDSEKLGALICYESAYGNMTRRMVNKGAQLLSVMLNEGWYDSLEGSDKFEKFSTIRAIETRRYVARSSNRGISSIIDLNGKIIAKKSRSNDGAVIADIPLSREKTIYVRFGHWLIKGTFIFFFVALFYLYFGKRKK